MLKMYLKLALRNLFKNNVSSFINIAGLTVGMAVAMFIGLWVYDELSFNKYHQNYDRIAQVMVRGNDPKEGSFINNSLQYPLATELQTTYKRHFKHIVRASWVQDCILSTGEKKLSRTGQFMEDGAPEMLSLKMIKGDWSGLRNPNAIIISTSTAKSLFGTSDPIEQLVRINNKMSVTVTGV